MTVLFVSIALNYWGLDGLGVGEWVTYTSVGRAVAANYQTVSTLQLPHHLLRCVSA